MRQCVLVIEVLNEEQGGHYQHESSLDDFDSTKNVEVKLKEGAQGLQLLEKKLEYKCSVLRMTAASSYRSKY